MDWFLYDNGLRHERVNTLRKTLESNKWNSRLGSHTSSGKLILPVSLFKVSFITL